MVENPNARKMHTVLITASKHRRDNSIAGLELSVTAKVNKYTMTPQLDSTPIRFKRVLFVMRLISFWSTVTLTLSGCEVLGVEAGSSIVVCIMTTLKNRWK